MGYTIKWRFLIKLAIVLILAGVTIHFVHRWQVKSQTGAFLRHADLARAAAEKAEKEDKDPQAASAEREREQTFLQRYVLARPDDIDVRERLVRLMCDNAQTKNQAHGAYFALEDVLRRDPDRDELRRFAIDYAMNRIGFLQEAKENLDYLFKRGEQFEKDGALRGLYARCFAAERKFAEAEREYQNATNDKKASFPVEPSTVKVDSYFGLASLLRQLNRADEANEHIHRMLDDKREDFRAYLFAIVYLGDFGLAQLPGNEMNGRASRSLESLVTRAYALAPQDLDVLIAAATLARTQRREFALKGNTKGEEEKTSEARRLLTEAINLHPRSANAYLTMAEFEEEIRQLDDAIAVVQNGLKMLADSVELLRRLLEYQFRKGDAVAAAETFKKLQDRGLLPGVEEFESARVLILEDKWKEAAAALERAIPQLLDKSTLVRQAHLLLGRCYAQLGEPERRLRAFTLALPDAVVTPQWAEAMIGIAESEAALGRADDALKTYRKMADFYPSMWERVARLELLVALRSDKRPLDLKPVDEALNRIGKNADNPGFFPDPTPLKLFKATLEDYRGNTGKAREDLEALKEEYPKNIAVRIELAMQAMREKKYSRALEVLDEASKEIGDSPDIRLARARVWAAQHDATKKQDDLSAKLSELAAAPASYRIEQKRRLLRGLAEIASSAGLDEVAGRFWDGLAAAKPYDIGVHLIRFDRAARAGDLNLMKGVSDQIRQQEGQNGRAARLTEAIYLIQKSEKENNRQDRDSALRLLDGLPPSGRVFIARALIHDLNGNHDLAKSIYGQAYERGEISVQALLRFVHLLSLSRDEGERRQAQAIIAKIENSPNLGSDFQRLAASVSLRADDMKGALEYFEKAKTENSTNYRDQLTLGQLYWRSEDQTKKTNAKPCFIRATELAPDVPETWMTLIRYLLATGEKGEAAKAFEQARQKVKQDDRGLFIAQYHILSGDTDKALEAFKRARAEKPDDLRILFEEANYALQTGRLAEASEGFRRVKDHAGASNDMKTAARRQLALAIAANPTADVARGAIELIPEPAGGNETPAEKRARAVILGLQKDNVSKQKAIQLLEENREGSESGERFLLAQLYNVMGNRTGVRLVMEELLKSSSNQIPLYLRFYARWLIREGELSRASEWIKQLEKVDRESLATAELKARLAMARKDTQSAREALGPKEVGSNAPLNVIAAIYEDIGLHDEAERLLKRVIEERRQMQPGIVLALAAFHGRRGQTAEGLRICEEMHGKLPLAQVAEVAINVLYHAPSPSTAQMEKVASWLDAAIPKAAGPERNALLQSLAAIRNLQGQYNEAAKAYKEILAGNPRDPLALNNLAYLISALDKKSAAEKNTKPDQKTQQEAIAMIEQAKRVLGDNTVLLDTEALIRLYAGDPRRLYAGEPKEAKEALRLMEMVVAQSPSGPAYYHLAQVAVALGDTVRARVEWRRARDHGFKLGDLHPLERPDFEKYKDLFRLD